MLQRLEPLLVPHPEPMLLVHDEQPEIAELHVLRKQPVRPDDDVQLPPLEALPRQLRLLRLPEA